jgi:O-antigen/teichoic acid export membrane protein
MAYFFSNIRKSKFINDFISVFSSNITIMLVGVLVSIITARILGVVGMGNYTTLTSFSILFVTLSELGIRQSNVYYIAKQPNMLTDIFAANFYIWLFSSVIGITAFLLILLNQKINFEIHLIITACFIIPLNIANSFLNGFMHGLDKVAKNSRFNLINSFIRLISLVLFVVLLKLNVLGALLVLIIPVFTNFRRKWFFLRKNFNIKIEFKLDTKLIKTLFNHGVLYGLALFLMTNQKKVPIYIMTGMVSQENIGLYGVGVAFSGLIYQLFSALAPIIFVKSAKSKDPVTTSFEIQKLMRVLFVVLILTGILFFFIIDYVLLILYGNAFVESSEVTKIMLLGVVFYNLFLVLNMDMAGKGKPYLAIYTLVPITVLNVILNLLFLPTYGIVGAAIATSFSQGMASVIYLFLYAREVNISVIEILKPRKSDWSFLQYFKKK